MSIWAHIINGIVVEITDIDPEGRFHPDLIWAECTDTPGVEQGWTYDGTTFAAPTIGTLPLDVRASNELNRRIDMGITITSTGTPALNSTYSLDDGTVTDINALAISANAGLGFPGGGNTFAYPDKSGQPRIFDTDHMVSLFRAMRDLVWQLKTQAAIMKNGGTAAWPSQSVTIP